MKHLIIFLAISTLLYLVGSCKPKSKNKNERPLARVYDEFLYPSELDGIVGAYTSSEDSALVVNAYIKNWAKKTLMRHVASENTSNSKTIKKQVEEYRASLEQYYYEQALVTKRLDSLVKQQEIQKYYDETKPNHVLKTDIVRCYLLKIPDSAPLLEDLKKWWKMDKEGDYGLVKSYCDKNAQFYFLDDSTWLAYDYLAAQFPTNSFNQNTLKAGKDLVVQKGGYWYFLRAHEKLRKGQPAPVSYVKEEAIRFILHTRKLKLIKETANDMLLREQNKLNVEIYAN